MPHGAIEGARSMGKFARWQLGLGDKLLVGLPDACRCMLGQSVNLGPRCALNRVPRIALGGAATSDSAALGLVVCMFRR
jgi:hypothetical protein